MTPAVSPIRVIIVLALAVTSCLAQAAKREQILIPSSDVPNTAIRVVFETGSSDDPPGREGLCALAARVMAHGGTEDLTHSEVVDSLYPSSGRVDVQVDKDYVVFIGHVALTAMPGFYPIFRDLLLHPRWDEADFAREKDAAKNYVSNVLAGADDEALGKAALESFIYSDGPYGHPIRGTVASLDAITLDEVRDFARTYFCGSRMRVGVAGLYQGAFPDSLAKDLSSLPEGTPRQGILPAPPGIDGVEILFVEKEDAPATAISIGYPIAVDRTHPDYWALLLANHWFGEHRMFTGRLMKAMRVARGLNYGDYSYIEAFRQERWTRLSLTNMLRRQQDFSIWIRPVEPANAHFALRQALRELEMFANRGIPDEEFDSVRTHLINYSRLWRQTLHRRLGTAMDDAILGTEDYFEGLIEALESMTADDVRRAVKNHLQSENVKAAVVCSNAADLAAAVRGNSPSPITYAGDPPAANAAEDDEIESYELRVTATEIVPAGAIFSSKKTW